MIFEVKMIVESFIAMRNYIDVSRIMSRDIKRRRSRGNLINFRTFIFLFFIDCLVFLINLVGRHKLILKGVKKILNKLGLS